MVLVTTTTFNLPDLRGEFIRGLDAGRGVDSGRALGSFQADEIKAHTHTITTGGTGTASNGGGDRDSDDGTQTTSSTGGGGDSSSQRCYELYHQNLIPK